MALPGCSGKRMKYIDERTVERFDELDTDGDGSLSRAEFAESRAAKRSGHADRLFAETDTDTSNALTYAEIAAAANQRHFYGE